MKRNIVDVPVHITGFDFGPKFLEHIPYFGFGYIGLFAKVPVQLVKTEQLLLIGFVYRFCTVVVKALAVLVSQGEKVCCRYKGLINGV